MNKFKKKDLPAFNDSIARSKEQVKNSTQDLIHFSFKYLSCKHDKFIYDKHDANYFLTLLEKLKNISRMKAVDFLSNKGQGLRAHPIKWHETSEKCFDLPAEEQLVDTPYQFMLTSNEYGRVHGFFINTTRFYIVWLDKLHELYPHNN